MTQRGKPNLVEAPAYALVALSDDAPFTSTIVAAFIYDRDPHHDLRALWVHASTQRSVARLQSAFD
jgi:hypothetical protein